MEQNSNLNLLSRRQITTMKAKIENEIVEDEEKE